MLYDYFMQVREVVIQSAERAPKGSLFTPDIATSAIGQAAVLFIHGYGGDRSRYAEYAEAVTEELDVTSLTIDLSGHGDSEGDLRTLLPKDHVADATAAYDFLLDQPTVDPDRMGVVGTSYGGNIAALLCRDRTPKSLLLRAPAIFEDIPEDVTRQASDETGENFRRQLEATLPANGPLRGIMNVRGLVTVVESEHDDALDPTAVNSSLAVAAVAKHVVIPGAGHVLKGEERAMYRDILVDWAAEL